MWISCLLARRFGHRKWQGASTFKSPRVSLRRRFITEAAQFSAVSGHRYAPWNTKESPATKVLRRHATETSPFRIQDGGKAPEEARPKRHYSPVRSIRPWWLQNTAREFTIIMHRTSPSVDSPCRVAPGGGRPVEASTDHGHAPVGDFLLRWVDARVWHVPRKGPGRPNPEQSAGILGGPAVSRAVRAHPPLQRYDLPLQWKRIVSVHPGSPGPPRDAGIAAQRRTNGVVRLRPSTQEPTSRQTARSSLISRTGSVESASSCHSTG